MNVLILMEMVFARSTIKASLKYEKHEILLIKALRDMDGLCISHRTLTAKGGVGTFEPGFLYITFRLLKERAEPARELTYEEIRECVRCEKEKIATLAEDTRSHIGRSCQ